MCFVMSVPSIRLSPCISAACTRRISLKFDIGDFYENLSALCENRAKTSGNLHADLSTIFPASLKRHKSALFE
jgi:hypothetical protein